MRRQLNEQAADVFDDAVAPCAEPAEIAKGEVRYDAYVVLMVLQAEAALAGRVV